VSFGLDSKTRERLRERLQTDELPRRRRDQRVRWVERRVAATVDFHGPLHGPVRDAVMRSVELG
jgi:hypothetical protein